MIFVAIRKKSNQSQRIYSVTLRDEKKRSFVSYSEAENRE